jgi:hypothetical protein
MIESESGSPPLLAVSMWLTWAVLPPPHDDRPTILEPSDPMAVVGWLRLTQIGARLSTDTSQAGFGAHQLVRVNLCNCGDLPVSVSGLGFQALEGKHHRCRLTPPVVLLVGARYPLAVEVQFAPLPEVVEAEVENGDDRSWIPAYAMPH